MKSKLAVEDSVKNAMTAVFHLDPSAINGSTSTDTVDAWDSLGHLNLISTLEEDFGLRFTTDEIVELRNFKDICSLISRKLNNAGA